MMQEDASDFTARDWREVPESTYQEWTDELNRISGKELEEGFESLTPEELAVVQRNASDWESLSDDHQEKLYREWMDRIKSAV